METVAMVIYKVPLLYHGNKQIDRITSIRVFSMMSFFVVRKIILLRFKRKTDTIFDMHKFYISCSLSLNNINLNRKTLIASVLLILFLSLMQ